MHVPSAGLAAEDHHFEVIDAAAIHKERTRSDLPIDRAILEGEHRTGNNRSDVGGLGRLERVGPRVEYADFADYRDRLTDVDRIGSDLHVIEGGGEILE